MCVSRFKIVQTTYTKISIWSPLNVLLVHVENDKFKYVKPNIKKAAKDFDLPKQQLPSFMLKYKHTQTK